MRSGERAVVVVVPNLFFATRIAASAMRLRVGVHHATLASAVEVSRAKGPALVILDLEAPGDPAGLIRDLKATPETRGIRIVAFYPHVHNALRIEALAAGADMVLPRSAFTAKLDDLLAGDAGSAD
jgi:DNA-binding NarL/FixJ family response regulator